MFVGEKLWKENAMLKLIENIPSPSPIKQTQERLREKIFRLVIHYNNYDSIHVEMLSIQSCMCGYI